LSEYTDENIGELTNILQCYYVSSDRILHTISAQNIKTILSGIGEPSYISMHYEKILNKPTFNDEIYFITNFEISTEDAQSMLNYYTGLEKEDGLYNYRKLPTQKFADIQKKHTSIGWIGNEHSADYTELAMFGPGSENLKSFIKNTDLHYFMLNAAEVEDKF
jgi:alkaline phosphatase